MSQRLASKAPIKEFGRPRNLALLLFILAAILRVVALGRNSLWFDEAVSYLASTLDLPQILDNTVQSSHPPLYYLLLHFWGTWVAGDASLRLLGVLLDLLLLPAIYILTLELLGDKKAAWLSALLLAVSPYHVLFSQELRMYTLLMLLVTAAAYAYLRAVRSGSNYWWFAFFSSSVAAIYTHLFAWLFLLATGFHTLIRHRKQKALFVHMLVGILLVILFLPWIALLVGEQQTDLGSLRPIAQASRPNPLKPLTSFTFMLFGLSNNLIYSGVALFLTLSIFIILILEIRKARRQGSTNGLLLPSLAVMCVIGLPLVWFLARPFFLPERAFSAASPFLAILLAWATTRKGSPLPFLVYTALLAMLAGSIIYLAGEPVKPPYRTAMALVEERIMPGDAVLHTSDGSFLPALRYADFDKHAVLAGDPDPRKPDAVYRAIGGEVWSLDEASQAGRRLWLVVALEHSHEWQREQAAFFEERYPLLESHSFEGIGVFLYDLQGQ